VEGQSQWAHWQLPRQLHQPLVTLGNESVCINVLLWFLLLLKGRLVKLVKRQLSKRFFLHARLPLLLFVNLSTRVASESSSHVPHALFAVHKCSVQGNALGFHTAVPTAMRQTILGRSMLHRDAIALFYAIHQVFPQVAAR